MGQGGGEAPRGVWGMRGARDSGAGLRGVRREGRPKWGRGWALRGRAERGCCGGGHGKGRDRDRDRVLGGSEGEGSSEEGAGQRLTGSRKRWERGRRQRECRQSVCVCLISYQCSSCLG